MKTGDLVTLSAYGRRLAYPTRCLNTRRWNINQGAEKPLIGLLTKIEPPNDHRPWLTQDNYHIIWIGETGHTPTGRESYNKFFYRKDLKLVSKA